MTSGLGLLSGQSVRQLQALDTTMHNVANIDTPGFKAVVLSYVPDAAGKVGKKVPTQPRETVDFRQGSTHGTSNPLDMAVMGEGFFTLETSDGIAYTRDGRFSINSAGELVNLSGHPVQGRMGSIVLKGQDIRVDQTGAVLVDGLQVDVLRITSFADPSALSRADGGLYFDSRDRAGATENDETKVLERSLEQSNVMAIQEMVRLIDIHRVFESYQKVMQTFQDMDKLSTGRIGRTA